MTTSEYLKKLRQKYERTEPPIRMRLYGWEEVLSKLDPDPVRAPVFGIKLRLAFLTVLIFVLILGSLGIFTVAKAALPGTALYPVKILTENFINRVNGNNQASIDNRADEIVSLAEEKDSVSKELKSVVIEYKTLVTQNKTKSPEIKAKIEKQHNEFDRVARESPEVKDQIKEAIDASETHREGED